MAPLVLDVLVLDEHVLVEDLVDVVLGRGVTLPSSRIARNFVDSDLALHPPSLRVGGLVDGYLHQVCGDERTQGTGLELGV